MPKTFHFVCFESRKEKRLVIKKTISELGIVTWLKLAPLSTKKYPEAYARAEAAYGAATKKYSNVLLKKLKIIILMLQYSGSRFYFERNKEAVAVTWNGLNGTRRAFMDGARDAGARTLFFELSPFAGRVTVDPCGVNYSNSLPRESAPYLKWHQTQKTTDLSSVRNKIQARKSSKSKPTDDNGRSLNEPFLFVPLQVPGDSQLRIYGGKFRTVEATIEGIAIAARNLPDGWHVRIKEHPSALQSYHKFFKKFSHNKIILDNETDTFTQVAASRGVVTVNSSVGLEAMYFEKPVIALGNCFWAIPNIAYHCCDTAELENLFNRPETLTYDRAARLAFLSYLSDVYYPKVPIEYDELEKNEVSKIAARLCGEDDFGFWSCKNILR